MYNVYKSYRGEATLVAECPDLEAAREYVRKANDRERTAQYWVQYPRNHVGYVDPVPMMQ